MNRIDLAKQFAHEAHDSIKQVRKYTGEPYWVHTDEVAKIVESSFWGFSEFTTFPDWTMSDEQIDMICAAHLHDVIEDVFPIKPEYNIDEIQSRFGLNVAMLVIHLTDVYTKEAYPNKNRAERKALERERIGNSSPEAKTIKLADLISNTKSIVEHDKDFAHTYLCEKFALLPYLADGAPELLQKASMQCVENMQNLGLTIPTIGA